MNDVVRYIKKVLMRTVLTPIKLLPIKKNRVLLINDVGGKYACNPKAIAEYLVKNYKHRFEIFYTVYDSSKYLYLMEKGIKPITSNSLRYFIVALTSNVIVTNSGGVSYIPLRKKQCVINTHHGGGAYKTAGIDMFEDSYFFRKDMQLSANQVDLFLSTNKKFTDVISKACLVPKEKFWEIGMPRNDCLLHESLEKKEEIRQKLGINANDKLVLYAPTYRKPDDNYYKGSIAIDYDIDPLMVCSALKKRFGGNWIFAYRLHPCVENKQDYIVNGAMDLSDYEDMQDLLLVADVLINDFSSSFWDFLLTKRPCFMYAPDLEHYVQTTKVYTPVNEWPFPKSTNNDELKESIESFDENDYLSRIKNHYYALGGCETGEATRLVCEKINDICK